MEYKLLPADIVLEFTQICSFAAHMSWNFGTCSIISANVNYMALENQRSNQSVYYGSGMYQTIRVACSFVLLFTKLGGFWLGKTGGLSSQVKTVCIQKWSNNLIGLNTGVLKSRDYFTT